jgi:hypothetical protein
MYESSFRLDCDGLNMGESSLGAQLNRRVEIVIGDENGAAVAPRGR